MDIKTAVDKSIDSYIQDNVLKDFLTNHQKGVLDMGYIGLTDIPAEERDDFGLGSYLDSMAQFIENCNTPMTISVQGTWGTGKTSFMKMVSKRLKKSKFIEFNTWKFSQFEMDSNLSINLIESLIDDMSLDEEEKKDTKALVHGMSRLAGGALGVAIEKLTGIGNLGGEAKEIVERIRSAIVDSEDANPVDAVKKIKESFETCVDKCKAKNNVDRVVIFVDDLDRLEPRKAVELLEVLKNFLDCKDCVFVLAIDYDVVCKGVAAKYGSINGNSALDKKKGKDFFDKIIQVPFKMPVAQYSIQNYLKNCLLGINDNGVNIFKDSEDMTHYYRAVSMSIGTNPRAIKRLVNSFQLLVMVVNKNADIKIEDCKKVLFALLCLQELDQNVYNAFLRLGENIEVNHLKALGEANVEDIRELFPKLKIDDPDVIGDEEEAVNLDSVSSFISFMISLLQMDKDENLSDQEMSRFRKILKFAAITSTDDEDSKTGFKQQNAFIYKGERYASHQKKSLGLLCVEIIKNEIVKPGWARADMEKFMEEAYDARGRWKQLKKMVIFDDIEKHKNDLFIEYPITFTDAVGYPWRWWSGYEVGRLVDLLKNEFDIDVDCVSVE